MIWWSAAAAWWGAAVSTLVAMSAVLSRRPIASLWPDPRGKLRKESVLLRVDNPGPTPLLIRRVRQFPSRAHLLVLPGNRDKEEVASAVYDHLKHGRVDVQLWVPPGETRDLIISQIQSDAWTLLVLRWSRQRYCLCPWSFVVVNGRSIRDFYGGDQRLD